MDSTTLAVNNIEAIFFDMNGTLRIRVPDDMFQMQSVERLLEILGKPDVPAAYLDELFRRYKAYTRWADENETSLSEAEIWNQWITPELPRERIEPQAVELMLALRNCKGRSKLKPGAVDVLGELSQRGYRLGVISNTTSTADLPRFIEECGLVKFFEAVVLSSMLGTRKPGTGIFREAIRLVRLDPAQCAYLGNKISKDVVGAHRAGFGMAMVISPTDLPQVPLKDQVEIPDVVIHELEDLLGIFPPRSKK